LMLPHIDIPFDRHTINGHVNKESLQKELSDWQRGSLEFEKEMKKYKSSFDKKFWEKSIDTKVAYYYRIKWTNIDILKSWEDLGTKTLGKSYAKDFLKRNILNWKEKYSKEDQLAIAQKLLVLGHEAECKELVYGIILDIKNSKKQDFSKIKKMSIALIHEKEWINWLNKENKDEKSILFGDPSRYLILNAAITKAGEKLDTSGSQEATYNLEGSFKMLWDAGVEPNIEEIISGFLSRYSGKTLFKDILVTGMNFMGLNELDQVEEETPEVKIGTSIISIAVREVLKNTDSLKKPESVDLWEEAVSSIIRKTRKFADKPWRKTLMDSVSTLITKKLFFENEARISNITTCINNGKTNLSGIGTKNLSRQTIGYLLGERKYSELPNITKIIHEALLMDYQEMLFHQKKSLPEKIPNFQEILDGFLNNNPPQIYNDNASLFIFLALEEGKIDGNYNSLMKIMQSCNRGDFEANLFPLLHEFCKQNEFTNVAQALPEELLVTRLLYQGESMANHSSNYPMNQPIRALFNFLNAKGKPQWEENYLKTIQESPTENNPMKCLVVSLGKWIPEAKIAMEAIGVPKTHEERMSTWEHLFRQSIHNIERRSDNSLDLDSMNTSF
ncbi:MAG TPA: hypothetical protein VIY47_02735, partial [Ignavibacteriaceae bacterium]